MLFKLKNLIDKYGAAETARLLARCALQSAKAGLGPREGDRAAVDALLEEIRAGEYERLVLRRGSFGWHTPLFQRAQQLARAMSRRGCLVLYEASPAHEELRGAEKLGEGLWLVNLRARRLRREIENAAVGSGRPRWVMLASPEGAFKADLIKRYAAAGWGVIYDYIDAIRPEISGGGCVPRRTRALCEGAMKDRRVIVTTSSQALLDDARRRGRDALLVENGVDCAWFSSLGPCPEDARFRALLQKGKPILCYYGALASWLDYEALYSLAADGRFSLLLIGAKYDGSFDRELAGAENVVFLGPRPYETLKDYAGRCSVLLVPFRRGEVGDAASPVKLFEYMALGVPVVAGDTAECRRCQSVLIAADTGDYLRRVEEALALRSDEHYRKTEQAEACAADWLLRADVLCSALQEKEEERKNSR
ncbi:MAG: glycosyltransferase [Oscillospiraceae bacterium]|nr:glycosyltransferase [Oscillospiraceae bacterium]